MHQIGMETGMFSSWHLHLCTYITVKNSQKHGLTYSVDCSQLPNSHCLDIGRYCTAAWQSFFGHLYFLNRSLNTSKYLQVLNILLLNETVSNILGSTGLLTCTLITDSAYLIEHKFYPPLQWLIKLIVRYFSRTKCTNCEQEQVHAGPEDMDLSPSYSCSASDLLPHYAPSIHHLKCIHSSIKIWHWIYPIPILLLAQITTAITCLCICGCSHRRTLVSK